MLQLLNWCAKLPFKSEGHCHFKTLQVTPESMPGLEDNLVTSPDAYSAAEGAHAIAILTEWDEFKTLGEWT